MVAIIIGLGTWLMTMCCIKKQEISSKIQQKTGFLSLHENDGQVFYSQIKQIFS